MTAQAVAFEATLFMSLWIINRCHEIFLAAFEASPFITLIYLFIPLYNVRNYRARDPVATGSWRTSHWKAVGRKIAESLVWICNWPTSWTKFISRNTHSIYIVCINRWESGIWLILMNHMITCLTMNKGVQLKILNCNLYGTCGKPVGRHTPIWASLQNFRGVFVWFVCNNARFGILCVKGEWGMFVRDAVWGAMKAMRCLSISPPRVFLQFRPRPRRQLLRKHD